MVNMSVIGTQRIMYGARLDTLLVFFFNDTAATEIYARSLVGSVRCV